MDVNLQQNLYHYPKIDDPCYIVNITNTRGIWNSANPWNSALPLLVTQLTLVIAVNQFIYFLLKPLHVPRIASDIAAGVMFGGSVLHRIKYVQMVFPIRGLIITETVAYWVLCLHLFLLGLSTDVSAVFRTSKKTACFALICLVVPFVLGTLLFFLVKKETEYTSGCFFFGGALAVTGFPVVARVLTDLRIIHSDIGRMALSTSLVNDLASWVLLSILLPSQVDLLNTFLSVALTLGFTAFCFFAVRPGLAFMIRKTSKDKVYSEHYLNFILASVSVFACASDALGTSPMVGAFVYGLVMPSRDLAGKLLETFEDVVNDYLLPLYFTVCGMRVGLADMGNWGFGGFLILLLAPFVKIVGALVASYFFEMSLKEGFALGVAMNGKNIVVMIILTMGFDGSAAYNARTKEGSGNFLSQEAYSLGMVSVILMTTAMPFILGNLYRPAKRLSNYQGRTIQNAQKEREFRILTCFQGPRNVSGIINLLDSSNATKDSPLFIFAINLAELTGRNSSMLIVHTTGKSTSAHTGRNPHIEQIITALDTYSSLNEGLVSVQSMTLLSPYPNMHEDICSLAEDKQVSFIVLPFHKQPSQNGTLEEFDEGIHYRGVNLNVMANAPCTVGLFVDKGFGTTLEGESNLTTRNVAMVFVGGPDDREALAYAARVSRTQGLTLTVVRFLPGDNLEEYEPIDLPAGDAHRMLTSISYVDRQRRLDDECVDEFRLKCMGEQVTYVEKFVNNEEETVAILKEMGSAFDLYIVGKGEGIISPLTAGLMDWCEFQELGALGDLLVTSSFAQRGSVLVVQQYAGAGDLANLLAASSEEELSTRSGRDQFGSWDRHEGDDDDRDDGGLEMEPFARHNIKNADNKMAKDEADVLEKGY